jgi:uncharacterized protein YwqG
LNENNIDVLKFLNKKLSGEIDKKQELLKTQNPDIKIYSYWEKEVEDLIFSKAHLPEFVLNISSHKEASKDWIHVLGISSVPNANIHFGDGKMEFFIHKTDLNNLNFNNVYCQIYG